MQSGGEAMYIRNFFLQRKKNTEFYHCQLQKERSNAAEMIDTLYNEMVCGRGHGRTRGFLLAVFLEQGCQITNDQHSLTATVAYDIIYMSYVHTKLFATLQITNTHVRLATFSLSPFS
jgi:hypothetical protein